MLLELEAETTLAELPSSIIGKLWHLDLFFETSKTSVKADDYLTALFDLRLSKV